MKILNFGSLNIDYVYSLDHFVKKGETISSDNLEVFSGGKGLNQSIAMGRAGISVFHAGAVGTDGESLLQLLRQVGVSTELVAVSEAVRTGNAIIQRDRSGDNCIILYGGANQSISSEQIERTLALFAAGDYLVLQNEINGMREIMEKAHQRGLRIVLNPSPMNEKIEGLPLRFVDYFILNEIEAKGLLGREDLEETDGEKLIRQLADRFPEAGILLTLGSDGAMYLDKNENLYQPAYKVAVKDTTAAGDTFTGYFMAGLLKGLPKTECMKLAAKAAAIAVSRPGAAPSIPEWAEVERFGGEA